MRSWRSSSLYTSGLFFLAADADTGPGNRDQACLGDRLAAVAAHAIHALIDAPSASSIACRISRRSVSASSRYDFVLPRALSPCRGAELFSSSIARLGRVRPASPRVCAAAHPQGPRFLHGPWHVSEMNNRRLDHSDGSFALSAASGLGRSTNARTTLRRRQNAFATSQTLQP